jgi:hypothetical protein
MPRPVCRIPDDTNNNYKKQRLSGINVMKANKRQPCEGFDG